MYFIASASTDIGIAKDTNQDSFSVKIFSTCLGSIAFAVLCDGMGGLSKGEVASATVVSAFNKWAVDRLPVLCEHDIAKEAVFAEWNSLIKECNEKIKIYGETNSVSLGTTVTAMLITEKKYFVVNVGDTRAYEIADFVSLITRDQTVVAREVELGMITEEQAKCDPRRSVLLQCVGASDTVEPDMFFGDTRNDTVYMLCSDGFRHEVSNDELYSYLNPEIMCDAGRMKESMNALIELNKQRRERDNISVITIRSL